jgi:Spy/CpxP family protein refolding chaperone
MQEEAPRRRFLGLPGRAGVFVLGLALLSLAAAAAAAPAGLFGHTRHGHGFFGHGGHGRGGHAWNDAHLEKGVRHLLDEADASDEQIEAVTAIVSSAAADLRALHDAERGHRDAWREALVAADRATLEARRAEALLALEAASERVVAALADAAEVLTPEQRQRLAEAHAAHHFHD